MISWLSAPSWVAWLLTLLRTRYIFSNSSQPPPFPIFSTHYPLHLFDTCLAPLSCCIIIRHAISTVISNSWLSILYCIHSSKKKLGSSIRCKFLKIITDTKASGIEHHLCIQCILSYSPYIRYWETFPSKTSQSNRRIRPCPHYGTRLNIINDKKYWELWELMAVSLDWKDEDRLHSSSSWAGLQQWV